MVLEINGNTELIYNLEDVSNIIRKYYNKELAYEMDRLIDEHYENYGDLESMIEQIKRIVW